MLLFSEVKLFILNPTLTQKVFTGFTNAHGPSLQPIAGRSPTCSLTSAQEVARPKARFKPTLPKKSGVDGGAISWQHILVTFLHCNPQKYNYLGTKK